MKGRTYRMTQFRWEGGEGQQRDVFVQARTQREAKAVLLQRGIQDAYRLSWVMNKGFAPGTIVWGRWERVREFEEYFE